MDGHGRHSSPRVGSTPNNRTLGSSFCVPISFIRGGDAAGTRVGTDSTPLACFNNLVFKKKNNWCLFSKDSSFLRNAPMT